MSEPTTPAPEWKLPCAHCELMLPESMLRACAYCGKRTCPRCLSNDGACPSGEKKGRCEP